MAEGKGVVVVEATWEKRNLGLCVVEVECQGADDFEILTAIREVVADMTVVRLDVGRLGVIFELAKLGFVNVETLFRLKKRFRPSTELPLPRGISMRVSDDPEASVFEAIYAGMFKTDRISLDPHIPREASINRMAYWVRDELGRGADVVEVMRGTNSFAFFIFRKLSGEEAHIALSGVIPEKDFPGAGQLLQRAIIQWGSDLGLPYLESSVSSNNLTALRSNLAAGFELSDAQYVLIRHQSSDATLNKTAMIPNLD